MKIEGQSALVTGGGLPAVIYLTVQSVLDGRVIAESTSQIQGEQLAAARRQGGLAAL